MALTVITEDPAVRELGDLIIVDDLVGVAEFVDQSPVGEVVRGGESEGSEHSGGAGHDPSETEGEQKQDGEDDEDDDDEDEDDEADGEAEDDDTESERS
jgi:hypothetical protein